MLDLIDDLPIRPDSHQLSEEEYEEKKYADFLGRKNGKTAVTPYSIADTRDWLGVYALFDTQDAVLIGYPFESGSRSTISTGASFLITSFTSMPEEAWKLVKSCCTTYSGAGGLPILKSALQSEVETYIGKTIISYFSGGSVSIETNPYRGAKNDDLTRPGRTDIFTASDAENFISFLNENAGIPIADFASAEISAIFTEEISAYLSGIGTAEECTKKVQSRIEIWLNEQN